MKGVYKQSGVVVIAIFLMMTALSVPVVSQVEEGMPFVMAYGSDIGELNPLTWRSESSRWYDMLVYDTLLTYGDDHELIPWLASDYGVSFDGLQINFTIREGAKWHDGVDLTADDVSFTFEYIRDAPDVVNWWTMLQDLASATPYGNVVVCEFNQLHSFALHTLGEIYILPEHIWSLYEADDARWNDATNVVAHTGSGPFKYVERVPDEYTDLVRFDDWWGPGNPYVGQLPNIDSIRINVIIGQDARITAMRNGDADTERYEVFGAYVDEVLSYPELQLVQGVPSQWDYVWGFNLTIPGLDDIDVRRAMSLAINRDELITIGSGGHGTRTDSAIPEVFFPDQFHDDGIFQENVDRANSILNLAGYYDNDADGNRNFPGTYPTAELEFDLRTLSWDDISVFTGLGIVLQMSMIGITINNIVTSEGPMYDALYTGEYEMYTMAHGYSAIPDHVWWRCHSSNIYEWGDNIYHLDNATVDAILDGYIASTASTLSENARLAAKAIVDNIPYVPLYLSDDTHAMRAEWVNYTTPAGGPFTSFNPRTMVFMYDNSTATSTTTTITGIPPITTSSTTTTTSSTTTTTSTNITTPGLISILTMSISIGSLVVIAYALVMIVRNKKEL